MLNIELVIIRTEHWVLVAHPKSGCYNGLIYHKVFRLHELLASPESPIHFCEMVLVHHRKHGMNVLKVINDKLVLHPADWQHGNFDSVTVEMGNEI